MNNVKILFSSLIFIASLLGPTTALAADSQSAPNSFARGCDYDFQCPRSQVCYRNRCVQGNADRCVTNSQCASNEHCLGGACVPRDTDNQCQADDGSCPAGYECVDGACQEF